MKSSWSYQQWKSANIHESFSWFDFAHCAMRDGGINSDLAIAFARLIWPEFVELDGMVFLADQYSEERASSLKKQGISGNQLEYWMNLFSVDGLFSGVESSTEEAHEQFANVLANAWHAKLRTSFPSRTFLVKVVRDDEAGDLCVVFTQGIHGEE